MRRILIVIDGSDNDIDSLTAAKIFAELTGAQLSVAYAQTSGRSPVGLGEIVLATSDANRSTQSQAQAQTAFDTVCGDQSNARFLVYNASCDTITTAIGHAYDLIIVERLSNENGPEASNLNAAIFDTGRLVLLIPPNAANKPVEKAAIAWNGSVQTARAIKSSLPLLKTAKKIVLLTGNGMDKVAIDLLVEYLAAYDLKPEVQTYRSDRLTARARGRALIAAANQLGTDYLITGAFGESQAGAIGGLGRATRKIVTAAPMTVLLQS